MTKIRCCDVERLWDEMRDAVESHREAVTAHLRECVNCQELYAQYEGVAYCLTCLPPPQPPADLVPKIIDHIRSAVKATLPDNVVKLTSPIGAIYVAFRASGITYVALDRGEGDESAMQSIKRRLGRSVVPSQAPQWVSDTIDAFFFRHVSDLEKVDISDLTPFEQATLRACAKIPAGEVRSYGWVAKAIGQPTAARAVGGVMARNPVPLLYPCHRVVDSEGRLHNYGYGVEMKARLLEFEGCTSYKR
jgi:methylated-DNA-[protein]-cysteine S-methyltransferase